MISESMFTNAYSTVRESIYFLLGQTGKTVSWGTAFMFAPGALALAAHVLCKQKGDSSSFHDKTQVMRDPEMNSSQRMELSTVIGLDNEYDIGLIRIENPRTKTYVTFASESLRPGTGVGSFGYPLVDIDQVLAREAVPLLRFQGGHISAAYGKRNPNADRLLWYYEIDMPMYQGSSGCPGFLADGRVFGMHTREWRDGGTTEPPRQRAFSMWVPPAAIVSFAQGTRYRDLFMSVFNRP